MKLFYSDSLFEYCLSKPLILTDPFGENPVVLAAVLAWLLCQLPHFAVGTSYADSGMRHCWTACAASRTCGTLGTLIAGFGFEVVTHTIYLVLQREGFSDAFRDYVEDSINNSIGAICAGFENVTLPGVGNITRWLRKSCECCCSQAMAGNPVWFVSPWESTDRQLERSSLSSR